MNIPNLARMEIHAPARATAVAVGAFGVVPIAVVLGMGHAGGGRRRYGGCEEERHRRRLR